MLDNIEPRSVRDVALLLRTLPFLNAVALDDLTLIAENALPRRYQAGQPIILSDERGALLQMLTYGRARVVGPDYQLNVSAPNGLGFANLVATEPPPEAFALTECASLEVVGDFMLRMLEENFSFFQEALRSICNYILDRTGGLPNLTPSPRTATYSAKCKIDDTLVDRLAFIHSSVLDQASLDAAIQLARNAELVRFQPGDVIFEQGTPARTWVTIVCGRTRCANEVGSVDTAYDAALGILDCITERPRSYGVTAIDEVVAYRLHIEQLLSVLRTRPDLAMGLLRRIAHDVIRLLAATKENGISEPMPMPSQATPQ